MSLLKLLLLNLCYNSLSFVEVPFKEVSQRKGKLFWMISSLHDCKSVRYQRLTYANIFFSNTNRYLMHTFLSPWTSEVKLSQKPNTYSLHFNILKLYFITQYITIRQSIHSIKYCKLLLMEEHITKGF